MRTKKLFFLLFISLCLPTKIYAQWSLEAYGGPDCCIPRLKHFYDTYYLESSPKYNWAIDCGFSVQYNFNSHLGIRVDGNWQKRIFWKGGLTGIDSDGFLYSLQSNPSTLLTLPVQGCLIMPWRKFSFYIEAGPYAGAYLSKEIPMNQKSRFEAGIVGTAGVGWNIYRNFALNVDFLCFQSLTDNHETGSQYFKQPIYYTLLTPNIGIRYLF